MTSRGNLSLPQLAERYHIRDIFGGSVAYFSSKEGGKSDLRSYTNSISCHELHLIRSGEASVTVDGKHIELHSGDLLLLHPFQPIDCSFPDNTETEGLLLEDSFYQQLMQLDGGDAPLLPMEKEEPCLYHLDAAQTAELSGIFQQIRRTIHYVHIYKVEMLRSLVHVCLLFVSELPYDRHLVAPDLRHKQDILKIFFFLARKHFRRERQIGFYADKLGITTTYLSRVVRELTGNTINNYLSNLAFEEACNLLRASAMTIGEIAFALGFSDQSAFTNFFKTHAGCSPTAYQKAKEDKAHVGPI
jgi:AraC-like DNA-binding protein